MEREISDSVQIAIALIAISLLISIIWVTVRIGDNLKVKEFETGVEIESSIASSQLNSIKYKSDVIGPKIAIYNLLTQEGNLVTKLVYTTKGLTYTLKLSDTGKWVPNRGIGAGGYIKQYAYIQDILADNIDGNGGLCGRSQIYVTPNNDGTFEVKITDLAV